MPNTLAHEYFWENCKKKMIMDYEKEIPFGAFDSELMHQEISIPKGFTATIEGDKIVLTRTESEDERTRKHLISLVKNWDKDGIASKYTSDPDDIKQILAWLEKQGKPIDEEKVLIGARKDIALSIMDFLDKNTLGMCLSNMECEDLEDAVVNSDWSKVYNYMKKKLEKQGEQKPVDKVEPKFHWGDCVVDNCGYVWKVEGILNQFYILEGIEGGESRPTTEWVDKTFHLWTIKDAKNGDVLASELCYSIILFRGIKDNNIDFYCDYDFSKIDVSGDRFAINNGQHYGNVEDSKDFHPATKEQRGLLFSKMKEAGYEWDAGNLQLTKILPVKKLPDGINIDKQKTAEWSEEDQNALEDVREAIVRYWGGETQDILLYWLKSIKQKIKGE